MKLTTALLGLSAAFACSLNYAGATLIADYNFNGGLTSSVGGAPDLTVFTGGLSTGSGTGSFSTGDLEGDLGASENVWSFGALNGLAFDNSGSQVSGDYSIAFLFEFDVISGSWIRMYDNNGSLNDEGLYVRGTGLQYYNGSTGGSGTFSSNQYEQVVLNWDSGTSTFTGYVNGVLATAYTNANEVPGSQLTFFKDDSLAENESGSVARLQIYDHALSTAEISTLDLTASTNVPDHGTTATLMGLALLGLGAAKRKTR